MNSKWYISTLILVLCVLGISKQQRTIVPNQEIVLQFSNDEVDASLTEHAIANVKKQLHALGVLKINVSKPEAGLLKISYFSQLDVSAIKCLLSKEQHAKNGYAFPSEKTSRGNGFPSEDNDTTYYELKVFELHQANEMDASINGKLALESRSDKDRFFNPNDFVAVQVQIQDLQLPIKDNRLQTKLVNAIAFDDLFQKIPEVRAGPSA
ncbi:hypothetical protein ESY86_04615 [Subsaximicrobium wynnwilliamsii]|uniref:Uncharacterized protein n=1 Tax=Subsaximicrobium wynnwilliamsii TaxID=291179 RepID=A0A5C6ZJS9_9FLAO|nr:hypothetical protein [Subsaximicrobium wynnwilliamsii]TXD84361.1 hypothetical protein ESY87_04395 [Subsaximicrobium wynnwilliamsii]TXD90042.1 hypothetical protein ESY86_04615 [Subsaximicrobium wynnwilliamsii]TXE04094.1 hypothetical protein ESY88_04390 [Subsaximicrobium wynnwilliamsii]